MFHIVGIIAGILALIAPIPYIRDILSGSTKPNRATWVIWTALLSVALASQLASGATYSALLTVGDLLGAIAVLALSIKHGIGGWQLLDRIALVGAAVGLLLWYVLKSPLLALSMIILVDYSGGTPTIFKTYRDPDSETISTYYLVGIGSLLAVISVGRVNLTLMAYPFSLMILMFLVVGAMMLSPKKKRLRIKHA